MIDKKTILFADDDYWFVEPFVEELTDAGFEVLQSGTGKQTEEILKEKRVDLIVLDIMMPTGEDQADPNNGKRTGIRIAELVRVQMKSTVPIIYLTVISDMNLHSEIEKIEREAGLEPVILVKPVFPEELLRKVNRALEPNR